MQIILANHAETQILTQTFNVLYKIIHQLVDTPPHGTLGKHLVHPIAMTFVTSKYTNKN